MTQTPKSNLDNIKSDWQQPGRTMFSQAFFGVNQAKKSGQKSYKKINPVWGFLTNG